MNSFHPVKTGKVSKLIIQQIKTSIMDGTIKPGDKIPPERELVEQFQASRISVREALKNLETFGLLTIKPGSGVFVAEINSKRISELLSSVLRFQKATLNNLTEARVIFEPIIAKIASERIKPEKFRKLEQNIQDTLKNKNNNSPAEVELHFEFHNLIAEATNNLVLESIMKVIIDVGKEWIKEYIGDLRGRIKVDSHAISFHNNIFKAFCEKNSQKVHDLMLKHLLQIHKDWMKIKPETK